MSHVIEHCATPRITRAWKSLGFGAVWACSCGRLFRLTSRGGYDGINWGWEAVKNG